MKNKIVISVVIVNWNGKKWLKKCISSVESQSLDNVEIILSDNNSTDGSLEYVHKYFPKVVTVHNKANLGFAAGVNSGIAVSKGAYIALLNTDAYMDRNGLELLLSELKTRDLDVVAPVEQPYIGKTLKLNSKRAFSIDLFGHPYFKAESPFYLSGVCLLFKKLVYEESGGLDNNFFMYVEEVDWFWRLKLMGRNFGYTDKVNVYHAGGGSSGGYGLNKNIFLWRNTNTLQMLIKNYRYTTLLFILPIYAVLNVGEMICVSLMKPSLLRSYIKPYIIIIKRHKILRAKHKLVRQMALYSDRHIMKDMYKGTAKPAHLLFSIKNK